MNKKQLKEHCEKKLKFAGTSFVPDKEIGEHKLILKILKENEEYEKILNDFEIIIQTCIYGIEPEGTTINFNCEYESEEDYIRGIETRERLITYKFVLHYFKKLKKLVINERR